MDRFSFVMVLLSIIVGLGVTELLSNVAKRIQNRAQVRGYWVHSALALLVALALMQQWWEAWDQRNVETWTFPILLLMLGGPVGLYIISHLLFPRGEGAVDLKAHYFEHSRTIFLIAAATVFFATIYRPLSFGHSVIDPDNAISLFGVTGFFVLAFVKRPIAHEIFVPLALAAALFDILYFHMSI